MPRAIPTVTGPAALLARAFPALGSSDEGRALAFHLADIGDAILSLAQAVSRG